MISQVSLKGFLGLELVLKEPVHFDQVSLNVLKLIGRHVLRVQHEQIVIKDVALD